MGAGEMEPWYLESVRSQMHGRARKASGGIKTSAAARKQVLDGVIARDFNEYFLRLLPKVGMLGLMKNDPDMADSDVTIEYLIDNVFIVGSVDEVAQKLNDLRGDIGEFGTLLAMGHEWEPHGPWLESMSLLKNEVLPKIS